MPLDPEVGAFLDELAQLRVTPLWEMTPEEARAASAAAPPRGTYPDQPAATVDLSIPVADGHLGARAYLPSADDSLPVVAYFHGGGWVLGSVDGHDRVCQQLAVRIPAVVVSVDYRLAPEHPFPVPVEDAMAATRWIAEHAHEIGGDASRLAVAGDSAGANLSAVVCLRSRDEGGPDIRFQLLVYPVTDLTMSSESYRANAEGYLLTRTFMEWFIQHYLQGASPEHPHASPLSASDLSALPPALVITAEFDPLRDEGEAYAARLREAGVDARTSRYDGMIHGFFGMDALFAGSRRAQEEASAALREALK